MTEYEIEAGDTLNGSSIGDIAYGYRVVPILHQRERQAPKLMPEDYLNLRIGDRIVVLADYQRTATGGTGSSHSQNLARAGGKSL